MLRKIELLIRTARHLTLRQIFFQIKNRLVRSRPLTAYFQTKTDLCIYKLTFKDNPPVQEIRIDKSEFRFLNIEYDFGAHINWNYQDHGKLWNYNLQYANYLKQSEIADEVKAALMHSQYKWLADGRLLLEPYPVSLRAINMMRWISCSNWKDAELVQYLYAELDFLSKRLEYHLLGNHLLENAFALMMGGAFFDQQQWSRKGRHILEQELEEQVLSDGAHFELSPMYHQIIFFRVLELIDWYSVWEQKDRNFEFFLRDKASNMLAWLNNISFENGDIPHFNDSTDGIAYPTPWLNNYAKTLNVIASNLRLGESGYRSIQQENYEIKIDFAQIGATYQPGHAHADALSFILYYRGIPLFVEQGTSTYQIGQRRHYERSTQAHNTVEVNEINQSEVWGGFRVGRRAVTSIIRDDNNHVSAKHDGYHFVDVEHVRSYVAERKMLVIEDKLNKPAEGVCYLHLNPKINIASIQNGVVNLDNGVKVEFEGFREIKKEKYEYAFGFNLLRTGTRICISFSEQLITSIYFDR